MARLAEDHARARRLAEALANMKGVRLDPAQVATNIVIFGVGPSGRRPEEVAALLAARGVGVSPFGGDTLRAVVHLEIGEAELAAAIAALAAVLD